jgi:hypothetical protein
MKWLGASCLSLMLATPAVAGDVYRCEGKSTLTFLNDGREAVIKRPGEMAVSIPRGGSAGRFAWWSPFEEEFGCGKAPCAGYWQPAKGPPVIEYILDGEKRVQCTER